MQLTTLMRGKGAEQIFDDPATAQPLRDAMGDQGRVSASPMFTARRSWPLHPRQRDAPTIVRNVRPHLQTLASGTSLPSSVRLRQSLSLTWKVPRRYLRTSGAGLHTGDVAHALTRAHTTGNYEHAYASRWTWGIWSANGLGPGSVTDGVRLETHALPRHGVPCGAELLGVA